MAKNRKLLLDSARKLLTDRSFESVTIREICEHAGVANSTFYYHFKTKEELMDGLRAQDDRPLRTELLELVMEPNLTEQLLAVCMMRTARAERHGCSITAQYYKSVIGREDGCDSLDEAHRQEDETVLALVLRAQQAGLISRDPYHGGHPADQMCDFRLVCLGRQLRSACGDAQDADAPLRYQGITGMLPAAFPTNHSRSLIIKYRACGRDFPLLQARFSFLIVSETAYSASTNVTPYAPGPMCGAMDAPMALSRHSSTATPSEASFLSSARQLSAVWEYSGMTG